MCWASHVFGKPIAWCEWLAIRQFITDHDVRLELLSSSSYYRDKKKAPQIGFRMTWPIILNTLCYKSVCYVWGLLSLVGIILILSHKSFEVGFSILVVSLPILLYLPVFYGGYSASLICKKLQSTNRGNQIK
jgi:hypothetical protein